MKILLFDMDGVLLEAGGYHRALQETVRLAALEEGLGEVWLTAEDIAAYESVGATSEWDTSAISLALLLAAREMGQSSSFRSLANRMAEADVVALPPLERAKQVLLDGVWHLPMPLRSRINGLLTYARSIEHSRTHRIFQELVLGSAEFEKTYALKPQLQTESYLVLHDRTNLAPPLVAQLCAWLAQPEHFACILTSRPSRPPRGSSTFSTPEAELGLKLVGLEGMPMVGWGTLCWLGEQYLVDPQTLLKPSPVHALAALGAVSGLPLDLETQQKWAYPERLPLETAYTTCMDGSGGNFWQPLDGAEVVVFEDTLGGLRSAKAAQEVLLKLGIEIQLRLVGIARDEIKTHALRQWGAEVHAHVGEVLTEIL